MPGVFVKGWPVSGSTSNCEVRSSFTFWELWHIAQ